MPGGDGYGDPIGRDPEGVLRDVVEEKVTPEHAERAYGVVLAVDEEAGGAWTLDLPATRRLRSDLRTTVAAPASADCGLPTSRRDCERHTDRDRLRAYQDSTSRPDTRENSPTLRVTSTCELTMAMAAIMRSLPPIGRPSRRSCARTIP